MTQIESVAILGGGHGACAIAADLVSRGFRVALFSRSEKRLLPFRERGGVEYAGVLGEGFAPIKTISNNIEDVLHQADLLVVVLPALAHEYIAHLLAPHLQPDQLVLLNPGHTGGALHFRRELELAGFEHPLRVAETVTITHGARMDDVVRVRILLIFNSVLMSALPAQRTDEILETLGDVFPHLIPARNVLETSLTNINAVENPAGMVSTAGWIEFSHGNFRFYAEGLTPSVCRTIGSVDHERLSLIRALNDKADLRVREFRFIDYFHEIGLTTREACQSGDIYEAMQASIPNRTVRAPSTLGHRYLDEDVGFGLVPFVEFGKLVGISLPVCESLITLASVMRCKDFASDGLTLERMGLGGISPPLLKRLVENGQRI